MSQDIAGDFQKNVEAAQQELGPLLSRIEEVLDRIRPAIHADGGNVVIDNFDLSSGVLYLKMQGSCGGCPSSTMTLKAGIERLVREVVPEVKRVESSPG
ncbi:MAG: NifU family protein [Euryarchaeota archaeon]|nr:NifU family protein [Euryarchaeota archaeon]